MNLLYKNKKLIVPLYSNVDGDTAIVSLNDLQAMRSTKATQLSNAKGDVSRLQGLVSYDTSYYQQYASQNKWSEAMFHSNRLHNEDEPQLAAATQLVKNLTDEIAQLDAQIQNKIDSDRAAVVLQLNNANLPADKRAQLEAQKKQLEIASAKSAAGSKNKKIALIGAAIFLVLATIGTIVYKLKQNRKSATATK